MVRADVALRPLDEGLLPRLLATAVADADPLEVMPPVPGPEPGRWTAERRAAFLRFHRARSLAAEPVERTYAVLVGEAVAGAARLCPVGEGGRVVEAGLWLGRSHRGAGAGGAVFRRLARLARDQGRRTLVANTTPGNAAMRRILAGLGADLRRDGETVTARLDL